MTHCPPSTRKSERLGKQTPPMTPVKMKSQKEGKHDTLSPLGRSERDKNGVSSIALESRHLVQGSSSLEGNRKKAPRLKSLSELNLEAEKVGICRELDQGSSCIKRKFGDARIFKAKFRSPKKKKTALGNSKSSLGKKLMTEKVQRVVDKSCEGSYIQLKKLPSGGPTITDSSILSKVNKLREFWYNDQNAVVFDDQDRVVSSIFFILSLADIGDPFLVIANSDDVSHWETEFKRIAPSVDFVVYAGNEEARRRIRALEFCEEGGGVMQLVLLASSEAVLEDVHLLMDLRWGAILVDYWDGRVFTHLEQMRMLTTNSRVILFPRQLKDRVTDYLGVLSLLDFRDPSKGGGVKCENNISKLKEKLSRYMAYGCMPEPSKFVEYWVPAQISNLQLEQYCATLLSNSMHLHSCSKNDLVGALRETLSTIRKCCDHPYLVDSTLQGLISKGLPLSDILDVGIKASGKLQLLDMILTEIKARQLRVLILFQPIVGSAMPIGNVLEDFVSQRFGKNSYERVDTHVAKKQAALDRFNKKESGQFVFLLEKGACVPAIKLASVDTVVIFDSDLNPGNDLRALQTISVNSQFPQIKVFRLYLACTIEEKALILAMKDIHIDNSLQNLSHSNTDTLLAWGASNLFNRLEEFHASKSRTMLADIAYQDLLANNVLREFQVILTATESELDYPKDSLIAEVRQLRGVYCTDFPLLGESKIQSIIGKEPHVFWKNLLEGRNPCWRFPSSMTKNIKRVQHFDGTSKIQEMENDDLVKKRRKVVGNVVNPSPGEEPVAGHMVRHANQSLLEPAIDGGARSPSPPGLNSHDNVSFAEKSQDLSAEKLISDEQKSIDNYLTAEMGKLCEALELKEDMKHMMHSVLGYVVENHCVSKENIAIFQALQISMFWIAASVLKQKINRRGSLILARQKLNFECSDEDAEYVYKKLQMLNFECSDEDENVLEDIPDAKSLESLEKKKFLEASLIRRIYRENIVKRANKLQKLDTELSRDLEHTKLMDAGLRDLKEKHPATIIEERDIDSAKTATSSWQNHDEPFPDEANESIPAGVTEYAHEEVIDSVDLAIAAPFRQAATDELPQCEMSAEVQDKDQLNQDHLSKFTESKESENVAQLVITDNLTAEAGGGSSGAADNGLTAEPNHPTCNEQQTPSLEHKSREPVSGGSACQVFNYECTPSQATETTHQVEEPANDSEHHQPQIGENLDQSSSSDTGTPNSGNNRHGLPPLLNHGGEITSGLGESLHHVGQPSVVDNGAAQCINPSVLQEEDQLGLSNSDPSLDADPLLATTDELPQCEMSTEVQGEDHPNQDNLSKSTESIELENVAQLVTTDNLAGGGSSGAADDGLTAESNHPTCNEQQTQSLEHVSLEPVSGGSACQIVKDGCTLSQATENDGCTLSQATKTTHLVEEPTNPAQQPQVAENLDQSSSRDTGNCNIGNNRHSLSRVLDQCGEPTSGLGGSRYRVGQPFVVDNGASQRINHVLQPALSRSHPSLQADPLQIELERLRKEIEQATRGHENLKSQLRSAFEKEIAEIRDKYEAKVQDAEAIFQLKKKVVDTHVNKVLLNKLLADAVNTKSIDFWPSVVWRQHGFMQQLQQMSFQQTLGHANVGRLSAGCTPAVQQSTSLTLPAEPRSSAPLVVGASCRPPTISSISYPQTNARVVGDIRAAAPHLQSVRADARVAAPHLQPIGADICSAAPHLQPFRPQVSVPPASRSSIQHGVTTQQFSVNQPSRTGPSQVQPREPSPIQTSKPSPWIPQMPAQVLQPLPQPQMSPYGPHRGGLTSYHSTRPSSQELLRDIDRRFNAVLPNHSVSPVALVSNVGPHGQPMLRAVQGGSTSSVAPMGVIDLSDDE